MSLWQAAVRCDDFDDTNDPDDEDDDESEDDDDEDEDDDADEDDTETWQVDPRKAQPSLDFLGQSLIDWRGFLAQLRAGIRFQPARVPGGSQSLAGARNRLASPGISPEG